MNGNHHLDIHLNLKPRELFELLLGVYGPQGWWPLFSRAGEPGFDEEGYHPGKEPPYTEADRFEIAVGAVLTQNTSWVNVRKSLASLFSHMEREKKKLLPDTILKLEEQILAELVRSSGYYRQKAKKLRILADFFLKSPYPPTREALLGLWGIGPETADSILLYAWGRPCFVIDAYTRRIVSRLTGRAESELSYTGLRLFFQSSLPEDSGIFGEFHALLVRLGKELCRPRDPRCEECSLKYMCNKDGPGSQSGEAEN
jgi:endonuclease-3 related protein